MPAVAEPEVIDQPLTLVIPSEITNVETVQQLTEAATPFFQKAAPLCVAARKIVVTGAEDKKGMKAARETRLAIRAVRIDAEKARTTLKEESLRKGKAIDAVFNGFRDALAGHEEYLQGQEEFAERLAAEQKARVKAERDAKLTALGANPAHFNAGDMSEEAFAATVAGLEAQKKAAAEAAKAAAEARRLQEIADAQERARQAEENERLKAEAAERERAIAEERKAAAAERERIEAAARAEREKAQAEQAKRDAAARKEREKAEAAAAEERRKREAAEAELRAKEAAEAKRIADEKKAAAKAKRAPDVVKIKSLAQALREIKLPECKEQDARDLVASIGRQIDALAGRVDAQAMEL